MALRNRVARGLVWFLLISLSMTVSRAPAEPSRGTAIRSAERGDTVQTGARLERSGRWVEAIEQWS